MFTPLSDILLVSSILSFSAQISSIYLLFCCPDNWNVAESWY